MPRALSTGCPRGGALASPTRTLRPQEHRSHRAVLPQQRLHDHPVGWVPQLREVHSHYPGPRQTAAGYPQLLPFPQGPGHGSRA